MKEIIEEHSNIPLKIHFYPQELILVNLLHFYSDVFHQPAPNWKMICLWLNVFLKAYSMSPRLRKSKNKSLSCFLYNRNNFMIIHLWRTQETEGMSFKCQQSKLLLSRFCYFFNTVLKKAWKYLNRWKSPQGGRLQLHACPFLNAGLNLPNFNVNL